MQPRNFISSAHFTRASHAIMLKKRHFLSEHLEKALCISRPTASKYLEKLAELGLLRKHKLARNVYFINTRLYDLFANTAAAT